MRVQPHEPCLHRFEVTTLYETYLLPDVYCSVRSTVSTVEAIAICEVRVGFAQEDALCTNSSSKAESKTYNVSLLLLWNAM